MRYDLILVWNIFHVFSVFNRQNLFKLSRSTTTRGHNYNLFVPRSRLEVRHRFFPVRVINTWIGLAPKIDGTDSNNLKEAS